MPTISVPSNKIIFSLDGNSTFSYGSASGAFSGSNAGLGIIFVPQENFTLTQIIFQYTVSTTPSPATFDVGIQLPDATTGQPSGTFQTTAVWTCPTSGSGFASVTVPSFSMVKGTQYYIVIRNAISGYTGLVNITAMVSNRLNEKTYGYQGRTSGVWAATSTRPGGAIWLYSGTKYYGYGLYNTSGSEAALTSPNELGTTFQLPSGHPTMTLEGVCFNMVTINTGTLFDVKVRDSSGTLLATATVDGDFCSTTSFPYFVFNTPIDIVAGTKYYIMLAQNSGTTPLLRTCVNFSGTLMTDVRNGIVANKVAYNGTTYTETTGTNCQGYLVFNNLKYNQTGGTATYSLPAGFNQIDF